MDFRNSSSRAGRIAFRLLTNNLFSGVIMFLVAGSNLYGKCDAVPGRFFVGTNFVHLLFIPLIPLGTYLVREDEYEHGWLSGEWKGIPLGWFSPKSWIFAWLRAAFVSAALLVSWHLISGAFRSFFAGADAPSFWVRVGGWPPLLTFVGSVVGLWLLQALSHASAARARTLGNILDTGVMPQKTGEEIAASIDRAGRYSLIAAVILSAAAACLAYLSTNTIASTGLVALMLGLAFLAFYIAKRRIHGAIGAAGLYLIAMPIVCFTVIWLFELKNEEGWHPISTGLTISTVFFAIYVLIRLRTEAGHR
ncbi:MAG: hypothetical protein AB7U49_14270 [Hyphomicrobiaceae bacterium]